MQTLTKNIYVRGYSSSIGWDVSEDLVDTASGLTFKPHAAMDSTGGSIITWEQDSGSGAFDVLARPRSAAGSWGAVQAVDTASGDSRYSKVSMAADGAALLAWTQDNGSGVFDTLSRGYTAASGWDAAPGTIDGSTLSTKNSALAELYSGNSFAVWRQETSSGSGTYSIYTNMLVGAGTSSTVRNDFDGDGKSDIMWRNSATGANVEWFMNGIAVGSSGLTNYVTNANYSIAGMGDFDGDGMTDILWRDSVDGWNVHMADERG